MTLHQHFISVLSHEGATCELFMTRIRTKLSKSISRNERQRSIYNNKRLFYSCN